MAFKNAFKWGLDVTHPLEFGHFFKELLKKQLKNALFRQLLELISV